MTVTLPHDVAAERAVLGCVLLDAESMADVTWLEPEDFMVERHSVLWRSFKRLAAQGVAPDIVSTRTDLAAHGELERAGGIDYVAELCLEVPSTVSVKHYANLVVEAATRRRVHALAGELQAAALSDQVDVRQLITKAENGVHELHGGKRERTGVTRHVESVNTDVWKHLESIQNTKDGLTGVPYGFPTIDAATHGMQRGELTLLGARPSVGKSAFALNVAVNAARVGKNVLFVSIEMTRQSLAERMLSAESGVPAETFRRGLASPEQWSLLARGVARTGELPLWIHDGPGTSLPSLRSLCRRHAIRHELDLVVVDYLQLIRCPGRDLRERATEASLGLKEMARELDVPVLALTQLNRQSEFRESGRPSLADLRDSGSLEQDADVVLLLWRPGMHNREVDKSVTELIIAKNRTGPVCRVPLSYAAAQTHFRERIVTR